MAVFDVNWIIGLGVILMLSLFMSYLTYKDIQSFFIFLSIFSAFAVWAGLLELWILIINMIVLTMILINMIYGKRRL